MLKINKKSLIRGINTENICVPHLGITAGISHALNSEHSATSIQEKLFSSYWIGDLWARRSFYAISGGRGLRKLGRGLSV